MSKLAKSIDATLTGTAVVSLPLLFALKGKE